MQLLKNWLKFCLLVYGRMNPIDMVKTQNYMTDDFLGLGFFFLDGGWGDMTITCGRLSEQKTMDKPIREVRWGELTCPSKPCRTPVMWPQYTAVVGYVQNTLRQISYVNQKIIHTPWTFSYSNVNSKNL